MMEIVSSLDGQLPSGFSSSKAMRHPVPSGFKVPANLLPRIRELLFYSING
jgi:hypothetical protein